VFQVFKTKVKRFVNFWSNIILFKKLFHLVIHVRVSWRLYSKLFHFYSNRILF